MPNIKTIEIRERDANAILPDSNIGYDTFRLFGSCGVRAMPWLKLLLLDD
ncbi:MAG: hypothetical protein O6909_10230 [Alphaproteobacteria bacterium]|nr:hypothetical protein [Alphaproteobacteria bacterium]